YTVIPNDHPVVTELIRAGGYNTAAFTEDGFVRGAAGFWRGFSIFWESTSVFVEAAHGDVENTFQHAIAWLARHAHEPFFLCIHPYQVHFPYPPPPKYRHTLPMRNLPAAHTSRSVCCTSRKSGIPTTSCAACSSGSMRLGSPTIRS